MDDLYKSKPSPFAEQLLKEGEREGIPIPKIISILYTTATYVVNGFDEIMEVISELEKL